MDDKDNHIKTAELSTEQNANMIDGIPNNTQPDTPSPVPEEKPPDKVKDITKKKRSRERDR